MTPDEFLRSIAQKPPAPAYLFIGPEAWSREKCRAALIERVLPPEDRSTGFTRHDLDETTLPAVIDDACSLSLFAANRVIWVTAAEAVPQDDGGALETYMKNPVPDLVIVFDSRRYDFDGDDKVKLQRVQKFYSALPQVEFASFTREQARRLAQSEARARKLNIGEGELDLL